MIKPVISGLKLQFFGNEHFDRDQDIVLNFVWNPVEFRLVELLKKIYHLYYCAVSFSKCCTEIIFVVDRTGHIPTPPDIQ